MKKKFIIAIGSVCLILLTTVCCLFVPTKTSDSTTVPAMFLCDGKLESTNFSINGTWTHAIATSSCQTFVGTIQIDRLDYTHKENSWNLNFQITDDMSDEYLAGGFFYNSNSGTDFTGYGCLYTNKDHDYYVLVTNQFDSQKEDYVVIAPAENEAEARNICASMGLNYLQAEGA